MSRIRPSPTVVPYPLNEDSTDILQVAPTTASFSVLLPDAVKLPGRELQVVRTNAANAFTVTVSGEIAGQTVGGSSSQTLSSLGDTLEVFSDGANWLAKVSRVPLGGSIASIRYRLVSDGTTVTAYDQTGTSVASGIDGGAVLTACLPAAASLGATIEFRNDGQVFPWGSVPALPKGITNRLTIRGNGATVQLSAGGPRFLDFNKTADHDTFQNIWIDGFVIDANNVGGTNHVILGTYTSGSAIVRINLANIWLSNIRTFNVPVDATLTNNRPNIYLVPRHDLAGEATQDTVTGIRIWNVRMEGGNTGIAVAGDAVNGASANIFIDDVTIENCWHSLLAVQSSNFASSNFIVGSKGIGGRALIKGCYGQFSADVGVEVDALNSVRVTDCTIDDCFNHAYYHTNYQAPTLPNEQSIVYTRCRGRRTSVTAGNGFDLNMVNSVALGTVTIRDCGWYRSTADITNGSEAVSVRNTPTMARLVIDGFTSVNESFNYSSASNITSIMFGLSVSNSQTLPTIVSVSRVSVYFDGQRSGAGVFTWRALSLQGKMNVDVNDVAVSFTVTTMSTFGTEPVCVGSSSSTIGGSIRRVRIRKVSDDANPRGIRFFGTATLTVAPLILVSDCDFSQLPAGGTAILFSATSNAPSVRVRDTNYQTAPAPSSFTGLVTATGKQLSTGWDAMVTFIQGTGAAITAIDYSTNGGITYTNLLTQASGALPAGFDQSVGPLPTDALIKVTFTTTQPTITLVPVRP